MFHLIRMVYYIDRSRLASQIYHLNYEGSECIPLIGKDGDDVIDNITCELTGTESMNIYGLNTHICAGKCV